MLLFHLEKPLFSRFSILAMSICLLTLLGNAAYGQQNTNLLDSGGNQKYNILQNAIESFALDQVGPAGDVISLMKAAPAVIREAKILQLKRFKQEAYMKGKFDKGDRYNALLDCWQFNDCKKAHRIQAKIRAKYQQQGKIVQSPAGSIGGSAPANTPNQSKPSVPACPYGQRYCFKGAYGPGGCYSSRAQNCAEGLICRSGYYACKLPGEPAHCQLGYTPCQSIKAKCAPPLRWCPPGPNGKGRCIRQNEICLQGLVCKKGSCTCKLPGVPKYCAPCGAICQPRPKPAPKVLSPCPAGLKYCPPGAFGRGGCIRPYQSCIKGLVCPTGYFYCKLPGEAAYCARPGSRCVSKKKPVQTPLIPPPQTLIPSRCAPPRVWCPAGAYGSGRCYVRGAQRCIRGMVCTAGFKTCKRPGQRRVCIPANQPCLIPQAPVQPPIFKPQSRCRPPQIWCPVGAYGAGGCYLPGVTRCVRGKTCPGGFKICKIPGERARCIPAMGMCLAQKRPMPPAAPPKRPNSGAAGSPFVKHCPPGPNGGGGMYSPSREICVGGALCPICSPRSKSIKCLKRRPVCGGPVRPPQGKPFHKPPAKQLPSGPHDSLGSKFGSKSLGRVRTRPKNNIRHEPGRSRIENSYINKILRKYSKPAG